MKEQRVEAAGGRERMTRGDPIKRGLESEMMVGGDTGDCLLDIGFEMVLESPHGIIWDLVVEQEGGREHCLRSL